MALSTADITKLKFLAIKSPAGLASILTGGSYKDLGKLIYPNPRYRVFTLKKKNGNDRQISAPKHQLKELQRRLAEILQSIVKIKPSAHGFVRDRSIVTNALAHCSKDKTYVFNIDLKDFFPSITFFRVRGVFMAPPFSYTHSVATVLAHLCCRQGSLPQGAPTSPILSNLICRGLDSDLQKLAQQCRATYTRYADDITFSFTVKSSDNLPDRIVKSSGSVYAAGESLIEIVKSHSFEIHPEKIRLLSKKHNRMVVTGITVNNFPNVRREFIHQIRGMLHAWDKYGLVAADAEFQDKKNYRRQLRTGRRPRLERVLWGKLLYLKMVKGDLDQVYIRLARRYNRLVNRDMGAELSPLQMLPVHDLIQDSKELDRAIYVIECTDEDINISQGTAFFLKGVGIVTCEHVIRHPNTDIAKKEYVYFKDGENGHIQLKTPGGDVLCDLEAVFVHRYADLAVLRPINSTAGFEPLNLISSDAQPSKDDDLGVVGYPDHKLSKSISCDWGPLLTPLMKNTFKHYDIKPLIRVGNSGGPVITRELEVVGMAKEGVKQEGGENAVLCVTEIKRLFDNGIKTIF